MRSFRKTPVGLLVTLVAFGVLAAGGWAQKSGDDKAKAKDKKKSDEKAGKKKSGKDGQPKETGKMDIPVSKEHDAKGLKIPYFDGDGKKQMIFTIGVASRIDDEHIGMLETQVETFDDAGESEMIIDLPKSELNVNTNVISTKKHVVIKREDFEITGETMEFNMKTRQGTLGGGVKMLIYNIQEELAAVPEPKVP
ncbi:MAG: LPS export ABC transporter periplasmic protein LptC [Chthoniobacter sp.]|nr:LPS export ABC transporter periplasmic protein LptC [Chthoniobacter sp.]